MTERPSCQIKLVDGKTNKLVDAMLFEGLSQKNIDDHSNVWIPKLKAANSAAKERGEKIPIAEDAHWCWSKKIDYTAGQIAFRHYAIEYQGETQGLMMVKLVGYQSRYDPPKDVLYIDFISVAPDNREVIKKPPKLRTIGQVLFTYSVQVSFEEGMNGRVGLHSLPGAAKWYRDKLNLVSFGPDPHYSNLEYFELKAEDAIKMLQLTQQS